MDKDKDNNVDSGVVVDLSVVDMPSTEVSSVYDKQFPIRWLSEGESLPPNYRG